MKPYVNMITLGVHSLEKATSFYEHGLDFPRMPFEGNISFFTLEGSWLALYPWDHLAEDAQAIPEGKGFRGITLAHTVTSEEKVLSTLQEAVKAGGNLVKPGQKTPWGGFSGYFSDLDGHLWEVAYNPFFWPGPRPTSSQDEASKT